MIDCDEALDNALREVVHLDPRLAELLEASGRPPLRKRPPGFEGLAAIVVSQQVSTASAAAIWRRVKEHFGDVSPQAILAATDADFRHCGLSTPKIRTMRAAADAVVRGALDIGALEAMPADDAHASLCTVKGIGPWTADIYLLFCIGHPDAFPAGDLALQEAVRMGYGLEARPGAAALALFSQRWRPWRGAAAKLLWAYYAALRRREGAPVTGEPAAVAEAVNTGDG